VIITRKSRNPGSAYLSTDGCLRAVFQDPEVISFLFFSLSSDLDSRTGTKSCKGKVEIQAGMDDRGSRRAGIRGEALRGVSLSGLVVSLVPPTLQELYENSSGWPGKKLPGCALEGTEGKKEEEEQNIDVGEMRKGRGDKRG
jgi:hypothetical protein